MGKKISILIVSECEHLHQCSETVFKLLIACVLFSDPSSEDTEMEMFTFPYQPETLKQSVPGSTPLFGLSNPPVQKDLYGSLRTILDWRVEPGVGVEGSP